MNNSKKGLNIEREIINHINEKKYISNMNLNIKKFIKEIFKSIKENDEIIAYKYISNYKPDIVIEVKKQKKYISIKSGNNNSIHQEHIFSFCNFLKECGITEVTINYLRLFHFNDGTNNGSGKIKNDAKSFILKHQNLIHSINKNFNNEIFLKKCLDRILFNGEYHNLPNVNYIYYGNLKNGIWASKNEIINYMIKNIPFSSSIHVSKIYYQSLQRNLKNKEQNEFRRYYVQFKWYSIEKDILSIMKKE